MGRTALLALLLCACADDSAPWLEVGTGEARFEPLSDGQDVLLEAGAQGGWHLWLSVRAGGIGPGTARIFVHAVPEGWDGPEQERSWRAPLGPTGEPFSEGVGLVAVLSPAECLRDQPLRLDVTVADDHGTSARDSIVIVPRAPPSPEMPPCTE
jgi:hypothetical protein